MENDPFERRPPRLKDLINKHVMGDVWLRDTRVIIEKECWKRSDLLTSSELL
jgi:hypothetical protein